MGTKYATTAVSGYNATPPADDGTVSEANKVKWSTIKTKLSDAIKTALESIDSKLTTHFNTGPTALTTNTTLGASHHNQMIQVSGAGVTLTLSDAATLAAGWYCWIRNTDSSNNVTIGRATGADTFNGTAANYTIRPNEAILVAVNAAANGFLTLSPALSDTLTVAGTWTFSGNNTHSGTNTHSGKSTFTANVVWSKGADVASANALSLGTDGNYFDITGTTAITSIGTIGVGTVVRLHFDAALTLTHHATDLVLPSGANITTAAGDEAEFVEYAAGDWRCTNYTKATGGPVIMAASQGASMVFLASKTASTSASLTFTTSDFDWTLYDQYEFHIIGYVPATSGTGLRAQISEDDGSTWKTSANYSVVLRFTNSSGTDFSVNSGAASNFAFTDTANFQATTAGTSLFARMTLFKPSSTSLYKTAFLSDCSYLQATTGVPITGRGTQYYNGSTNAINGIKFFASSGNMSTGTITVYGLKTS